MKIVLAKHMRVDTHAAKKFGIQIGIVGDIPNMKDSQGPSVPRFKIRQPLNAFCWNAGLHTHLIMPYCALTLVNPSLGSKSRDRSMLATRAVRASPSQCS